MEREPAAVATRAPGIPIAVVDAFASGPFCGNPAAVCILDAPADETWMQRVAAEMNLSETAFVVGPLPDERWGLRWFTPRVEVDLCGHATLAAAQRLWESGALRADAPAVFETLRSGTLTCRKEGGWIAMNFPARRATATEPPAGLDRALGGIPRWVGRSCDDLLVELSDAAAVRQLKPDFAAISRIPARGVIVTAASDWDEFDFVSRFFVPSVGIDEDPVTGSAHCTLGPYWAGRLGRTELRAWQASRRGGEVRVRITGDRVEIRGQAVTVWEGTLLAVAAGVPITQIGRR